MHHNYYLFLEYGHKLITMVVAGICDSELSQSLCAMVVPPPLTAAMAHVDREAARNMFGCYHRYGEL